MNSVVYEMTCGECGSRKDGYCGGCRYYPRTRKETRVRGRGSAFYRDMPDSANEPVNDGGI